MTPTTAPTQALAAAIAAHRFGLGEADLRTVGGDACGWLLAQRGPCEPQRGSGLVSGVEGLRQFARYQAELAQARRVQMGTQAAGTPAEALGMAGQAASRAPDAMDAAIAEGLRAIAQADVRARLTTAAISTQPFAERMALLWANHFTVSLAKGSARGVAGAFEREAVRPHTAGTFHTLLQAAVKHPGMLRYLDNDRSAGPRSRLVQRQARMRGAGDGAPRVGGLNENLAREVLELHTLGVSGGGAAYGGWGGYTQADVTEFARVLTGWRVPLREQLARGANREGGAAQTVGTQFDAAWHDPGPKTILGKRYPEGPEALDAVLRDLAEHPSTARFIAFKLARHVVADDPPPALVARLATRFQQTGGDLPAVLRTLVESPEAWQPQPAKLKTPEEFVVSTARLLGLGAQAFDRQADGAITTLGQRVQAAPSPAGWPDRAEDWLGPDAVWKRVEWATRVADRMGRRVDARALARASLGDRLHDDTARHIDRAADGPQALALLLLSPEFQRR